MLAYLARYTHRVAISNRRLIAIDDTHVSFRWKDYRENGRSRSKVMRLAAGEFMRRFLLHVLPDGFHRIRHYGLFANGHRAEKLALCRKLLDVAPAVNDEHGDDGDHNDDLPPCPCCGGRMKIIETFERGEDATDARHHPEVRYVMTEQPTFTQIGSCRQRRCSAGDGLLASLRASSHAAIIAPCCSRQKHRSGRNIVPGPHQAPVVRPSPTAFPIGVASAVKSP